MLHPHRPVAGRMEHWIPSTVVQPLKQLIAESTEARIPHTDSYHTASESGPLLSDRERRYERSIAETLSGYDVPEL